MKIEMYTWYRVPGACIEW